MIYTYNTYIVNLDYASIHMGMVHTCFKQVWATQGISLYTHCSAMLLSWFLFRSNLMQLRCNKNVRKRLPASLWPKMPLWTWDLMRKQATKPGGHAINQRKMEVSKVYLCKKQKYGMRHKSRWERNLMTCRYFLGRKPIPKFSTRRFNTL